MKGHTMGRAKTGQRDGVYQRKDRRGGGVSLVDARKVRRRAKSRSTHPPAGIRSTFGDKDKPAAGVPPRSEARVIYHDERFVWQISLPPKGTVASSEL